MANDHNGELTKAMLYLGGGALGWTGGWLVARYFNTQAAPEATPSSPALTPAPPVTLPERPPGLAPGELPSHPAQIAEASPGATREHSRLSRRFDSFFNIFRGAIPLEYLRALAMRESAMNPAARSGAAWGLMQITEVVRLDFNRDNGTAHKREDLLDPDINIAIACWLLLRIIETYRKHHPDVTNLRADWNNSQFVALLTAGWNAGFSEPAGVGRVVRHLKKHGVDVTVDTVHKYAAAAGAIRHLSDPIRFRWWNSVVELYRRERASDADVAQTPLAASAVGTVKGR